MRSSSPGQRRRARLRVMSCDSRLISKRPPCGPVASRHQDLADGVAGGKVVEGGVEVGEADPVAQQAVDREAAVAVEGDEPGMSRAGTQLPM